MDKRKAVIIGVIGAIVLIILGVNWVSRIRAQERIAQITAELDTLMRQRDSILQLVDRNTALRGGLSDSIDVLEANVASLRDAVSRAENARAAAQRRVRALDISQDIPNEFAEAFPAFRTAMRVYDEREVNPDGFEYLMVPLGFAESFIIHKRNSDSFERQRDSLLVIDALQSEVIQMQDSIEVLLDMNQQALQVGFDSATALATRRTRELEEELARPRFSFNLPSMAVVGGAAVLGLVIGTQIR